MEAICANPGPIYLMQPARSDSLIDVSRDLSSKRRVARLCISDPAECDLVSRGWNANDKHWLVLDIPSTYRVPAQVFVNNCRRVAN